MASNSEWKKITRQNLEDKCWGCLVGCADYTDCATPVTSTCHNNTTFPGNCYSGAWIEDVQTNSSGCITGGYTHCQRTRKSYCYKTKFCSYDSSVGSCVWSALSGTGDSYYCKAWN